MIVLRSIQPSMIAWSMVLWWIIWFCDGLPSNWHGLIDYNNEIVVEHRLPHKSMVFRGISSHFENARQALYTQRLWIAFFRIVLCTKAIATQFDIVIGWTFIVKLPIGLVWHQIKLNISIRVAFAFVHNTIRRKPTDTLSWTRIYICAKSLCVLTFLPNELETKNIKTINL